jgi:ABC-2 type transport system ATP-binding protein
VSNAPPAHSPTTRTQDAPPLSIQALVKHYGRVRAVDGISLDVLPGELVGFIGPNGAGKSTTYRCIVGLHQPDAGRVRVEGLDVNTHRVDALRRLGYVGQDLQVYQYLTGEELLRLVADLYELDRATAELRTEELVGLLGLGSAMRRLVREYSGGMARKVAIASALLARPPLLLLDESFAGLDPESTEAIRGYLDGLRAEGTAVLLSSHVLDSLERWVTRIVLLIGGRIVEDLSRPALDALLGTEFESLTALYLARVAQASHPARSREPQAPSPSGRGSG